MKAILYARVSSDEQAKGWSLENQITAARNLAQHYGMSIVAELRDDETGRRLDRPKLALAREYFRHGKADTLIVYRQDRLHRNYVNSIILREELRQYGVTVFYAEDHLKGINNISLYNEESAALQAERDVDNIRQRSMSGRRSKAEEGRYIGNGPPPYGYKRKGRGRDVQLVIDEDEAQIIQQIYHWYVFGEDDKELGIKLILEKLDGIPSPGDKRNSSIKLRKHGVWNVTMIYKILSDEVYAGVFYTYRYIMVDGRRLKRPREEWVPTHVPAIVNRETWEASQLKRSKGKSRAAQHESHQYLLGRVIACGCGYKVCCKPGWAKKKSGWKRCYLYYRCNALDSSISARSCTLKLPQIRVDALDSTIWNWILRTIAAIDYGSIYATSYYKTQQLSNEHIEEQKLTLLQRRDSLNTEHSAIAQMINQGIAVESLSQVLSDIDIKISKIDEALIDLDHQSINTLDEEDIDIIKIALQDLMSGKRGDDLDDQRFFIDLLGIQVILTTDRGWVIAKVQSTLLGVEDSITIKQIVVKRPKEQ
jgi:site-specific DNA recombinase